MIEEIENINLLEEPNGHYYVSYKGLEVWKQTRLLVNYIYELTKKLPKEEVYGLVSQMRRAGVSALSNIAEGCGRNTSKDSLQFFFISRGSMYELETQVLISLDQKYISVKEAEDSRELIDNCKKLLNGFINYYQTKTNN